jgi:hypothetical protein
MTAARGLGRLLKFYKNIGKESSLFTDAWDTERSLDCISSVYKIDIENGYYSLTHPFRGDSLNGEDKGILTDFTKGDNNDGITIIDFTDGHGKRTDKPKYCFYSFCRTEGVISLPNIRTFSAKEYVLSYYPELQDHRGIDVSQLVKSAIDVAKGYEVLTLKDIFRIFPTYREIYPSEQHKHIPSVEAIKRINTAVKNYDKVFP